MTNGFTLNAPTHPFDDFVVSLIKRSNSIVIIQETVWIDQQITEIFRVSQDSFAFTKELFQPIRRRRDRLYILFLNRSRFQKACRIKQ